MVKGNRKRDIKNRNEKKQKTTHKQEDHMNITKEELATFQIIALLADKHNCQYEIDLETKIVDIIGNIKDETLMAIELAEYLNGEI